MLPDHTQVYNTVVLDIAHFLRKRHSQTLRKNCSQKFLPWVDDIVQLFIRNFAGCRTHSLCRNLKFPWGIVTFRVLFAKCQSFWWNQKLSNYILLKSISQMEAAEVTKMWYLQCWQLHQMSSRAPITSVASCTLIQTDNFQHKLLTRCQIKLSKP